MSGGHQEPVLRYSPLEDEERNRRSSHRRNRGAGVTLGLVCRFIGLLTLLGLGFAAYFALKGAKRLYKYLDFPHHDIVVKDPRVYMLNKESALVRPLIDSSTLFDIRATVWLDVTQHLAQRLAFPSTDSQGHPIQLVHYNTSGGKLRMDAVLYNDLIFKGVAWKETRYTSLPLRIPIDPFYTQDLGPSSLRVTYHASLPAETEEKLTAQARVKQFFSIFPESDLMLPRSIDSMRTRDALPSPYQVVSAFGITDDITVSQALEWSGVSDNLLTIKPSYHKTTVSNCTHESNLKTDEARAPYFLDNASTYRNFTTHANLDEHGRRLILGPNCSIWIPHLKTRSSVFMMPYEQSMPSSDFYMRGKELSRDFEKCFKIGGLSSIACAGLRTHGPFESVLQFTRPTEDKEKDGENKSNATPYDNSFFRYAPQLIHRPKSAAPMDYHTLPRIRPQLKDGAETVQTNKSAKDNACQLPTLTADETNDFFDVTLDVRFAFLSSLRALTIDMSNSIEVGSSKEGVKEGQDIRFMTSYAEQLAWEAEGVFMGDGKDPRSRFGVTAVAEIVSIVIELATCVLTLLYWYTRTGTEGLSKMALRTILLADFIKLAMFARALAKGKAGFFSFFTVFGYRLPLFALRLALLSRIEIIPPADGRGWTAYRLARRPASKRERQSETVDARIGIWKPIAFIAVFLAYAYFLTKRPITVREGYGCRADRGGDDDSQTTLEKMHFDLRLGRASYMIQLTFNAMSPIFNSKKTKARGRKRGSFGGSFKITTWLIAVQVFAHLLLNQVEYIKGHTFTRSDLDLDALFGAFVIGIGAYQAAVYPGLPVQQIDDDDGDED